MTLAAWPLDTVQDQLARRVCRNGARHEPLDERACMPMAWLRREICNSYKKRWKWNKLLADARPSDTLSVLEKNLFEIWSTLFLSPAPSSTPQVLKKLSRTYKLRASSLTRGSFQEFGSCPLARYTRASSLLQKSTGRESSTAFSPPVRMQ
mgnify:CR=1 FL=1